MSETDEEVMRVIYQTLRCEQMKGYTHLYLSDAHERLIYGAALHLAIRMWVSGKEPPDTVTRDEMGYINYFVSRIRLEQASTPGEQW